jgi:hypothetical protein
MKTFILSIGIALLAVACSPSTTESSNFCTTSQCCEGCEDVKCQETCKAVSEMTDEQLKSAEGIKLIDECTALCKKNDCCSATEGKDCNKHDKKSCCKH